MAEITIVRTQEVPSPDPARAQQLDTMVVYQAGPGGVYRTVILPTVGPSIDQIRAAVTANETRAAQVHGAKFTI